MRFLSTEFIGFAVILVFGQAVFAANAKRSPEELFAAGTAAFADGRYEQALESFKAAEAAGLDTTALRYNLGVTYFKLKRYRKARQHFEDLTTTPEVAALAHYNLGRVALEQGDPSTARKQFQITYRTATDEKLRALADERLRELAAHEKERRWTGYLSIGGGYDDNAALIADSEVLVGKEEDGFLELIGTLSGRLVGTAQNGLKLKSSLYYQDYLDLNEYDFGDLRIGPQIDQVLGGWETSLYGFAEFSYIDRDLFERIFTLRLDGARQIYSNLQLRLQYEFSRIDAEFPYEDLTGNRHRLSAGTRSVLLGAYTGFGYTLELNDREDPDFPTRHSFFLFADRDLGAAWSAGVNASYRFSNYQQTSREDKRLWLGAQLSRSIPWGFRAFGRYDYIRNASNFSLNEYTSNVFTLGVERFF